jgi:tRNA threonylcarbamoyladenosine biosynthesis protein TsaB
MSMLLAIDASTEACSVALGAHDRWLERSQSAGQRHAELLLPMIKALLAEGGLALSQLGGIAFGAGPGSFTGLRIACGVAQGLALGADLPLVGVSTLESMAETLRRRDGSSKVVATLDARMGEIYIAAYEHDGSRWHERVAPAVVKPHVAPLPEGEGWAGAGSGLAALDAVRERFVGWHSDVLPSATAVGALSQARFEAGEGVAARDAHPIYIRHRVALTTAEREAGLVR